MSQGMGRRFFIGFGSGRYCDLPEEDQLPRVMDDIVSMRNIWTSMGYNAVLFGLGEYDSAAQIRQKLSHWSNDTGLSSRDVVTVYFAGHGFADVHDRHYLLSWDSRETDLAATALPTEDIVRILCQGELRHLLIILDTCAGAVGSADSSGVVLRSIAYRQSSSDAYSGLWFLASARRKDIADDGAFVTCFETAIRIATDRTGQRQRYLDLPELVRDINEELERDGRGQRAELAGGLITGLAPFIPNTGFHDDLPPVGTDLEIQGRIARQDLAEHFGPRSRGVEFESEQGLYFSGRGQVLTELVTWLTAAGDGKGRVVTGSPGCGKSAVLGRIVAPSIAWYRAKLDLSDANLATIVPLGSVTAAVHVRHKRLEEVVDRIAGALGVAVEGTVALLQELSRRSRGSNQPVVVVVDALDEAGSGTATDTGGRGEPRRIARELLRPMAEIPGVRLLVGARRELISSLGPAVTVLDLDDPKYRADEDVAGYVRKVLLAAEEPDIPTPYRGRSAFADAVAKGVAKRADGVFLVARMTARSLRFQDSPVDVSRPDWLDELPTEIGAAFDDWFARFGEAEPRVRRMLLPLAFAEGHGLPRGHIWRRLSSALAGTDCFEEDIAWALEVAQAYIAEVVDDGRSAYRLYHQALAEHLRATARQPVQRIQEAIVDALISAIPVSSDRPEPDWFGAAPYVRQHLATHARAAGRLGSLIQDPGFLLASGQLALLSALPAVSSEEGRRIRTAYEQVAHRLSSTHPLSSRAADLQLSARRCGADALADRIGVIGVPLPWVARWAWWSSTGAHRQLSGHTSSVDCVATANLDRRPIAVTGGWDDTARVWDLVTQQQIGEPLRTGVAVSAVAVGELGDYTVALTGGVDGTVRVWDLSAGREYGEPLTGHTNRIEGIAFRNIGDQPIALTASSDGTARIWNLSSRSQIGSPMTAHRRTVRAAALDEMEGRPIAVTGGNDRRLYIWDLSDLAAGIGPAKIDGRPLIGLAGSVAAVALGRRNGQHVAVVGDDAGMLSVWDLASRQQIGEPVVAHVYYHIAGVLSTAIGTINSSQVVLTSGVHDARLWDLDGLRQLGHPLRGHVANITGAALSVGAERPMAVTVSIDQTARVWDLTADQPAVGHVQGVLAAASADIEGRSLALTGGKDGTARLWDLQSRCEIGRPMEGHAGEVRAVALASVDGRAVAVTGGSDATVRMWDAVRGRPLGRPLEGHTNAVRCLRLIHLADRSIAITGSEDGTIRLWDVTSQMPLGEELKGHIGGISYLAAQYHDGCIEVVAATELDHVYLWRVSHDTVQTWLDIHLDLYSVETTARAIGVAFDRERPIALAAYNDNTVRAYDVKTAAPTGAPMTGHKSYVFGSAAARFGDDTVIATVGFDGIRLWELGTGRQLGEPLNGALDDDSFFTFAQLNGKPSGLVAFRREFRLWDLASLQPIGEPLCGKDNRIQAISIAPVPTGAVVITGGADGTLRTHALADGRQTAPHVTARYPVNAMTTLQSEGRLLAAVSHLDMTEVWDLTSRKLMGIFRGHAMDPTCIALCSVGDRIAVVTGSQEPDIVVWDLLARGPIGQSLAGHTAKVLDVCAGIAGGRPIAASASLDGTVRLWDIQTAEVIGEPLGGHALGATAVALGVIDNRDIVVTGAGDGKVRMWDLATCTLVDPSIDAHPDAIAAVRLETLGRRPFIITADHNGLVRAWDLRAGHRRAEVNAGSGINDIALVPSGELCVATRMGVVALQLNPDTGTKGSAYLT